MATGGITFPRVRRSAKPVVIDRSLLVYAAAFACIPLAFAVYWPFIGGFFVWDDFFFLRAVRNHSFPVVMARAFTFPQFKLFDEITPFWRPSIDLYFYLAKPLGIHAQPFHLVNFGLHGLVGALAVVFLWRLTRSMLTAVISGPLFVVVPTYDYAVTWVGEVSELLGAALILAVLLTYHAYLTAATRRRLYALTTIGLLIGALLTKESTVILAVLLPALVFVVPPQERRRSWPEIGRSLVPVLFLVAAFTVSMEVHEYTQPGHLHSFGLHMALNLWPYLKWMVLPYLPDWAPAAREALAGLFLAVGVGALLLRQRQLAFLFLWTIVAIIPFTGFSGDWIEFRYTYLAALPFTTFVVSALVNLAGGLPRPFARAASGLLVLAVAAALMITPLRTRDQQAAFARESANYEQMVDGVRNLCGAMPPESFVYVVHPPYIDLWGVHTHAALNLYYHHVNAAAVAEVPPLAAFITNKCVIQYDAQSARYIKIE